MPISLAPPEDNSGWVIDSKIDFNGVPQYIVSHPDKPHFRPAVRLEKVLDWVSQRVYENFEFELLKTRARIQWEKDEEVLRGAKTITRKRQKVANKASIAHMPSRGQEPQQVQKEVLTAGDRQANTSTDVKDTISKSVLGGSPIDGERASRNIVKRKRTSRTTEAVSTPKRQAVALERPESSSEPSLSEEARQFRPFLVPDLSTPILDNPAAEGLSGQDEPGLDIISHKIPLSWRNPSSSRPPSRQSFKPVAALNVIPPGRWSMRSSQSSSDRTENPTPSAIGHRGGGSLSILEDLPKIFSVKPRSTPNGNGDSHSKVTREASSTSASSSTTQSIKKHTITTPKKEQKCS